MNVKPDLQTRRKCKSHASLASICTCICADSHVRQKRKCKCKHKCKEKHVRTSETQAQAQCKKVKNFPFHAFAFVLQWFTLDELNTKSSVRDVREANLRFAMHEWRSREELQDERAPQDERECTGSIKHF